MRKAASDGNQVPPAFCLVFVKRGYFIALYIADMMAGRILSLENAAFSRVGFTRLLRKM